MIAAFWEMIFLMCCSRSCGLDPSVNADDVAGLADDADPAPPDDPATRDLGRISATVV